MTGIEHLMPTIAHLHKRIVTLETQPHWTTKTQNQDIDKLKLRIQICNNQIDDLKHYITFHKQGLTHPDLSSNSKRRHEKYIATKTEQLEKVYEVRNQITLELVKCLSGQDFNPNVQNDFFPQY